ncbi:MAG: 4-hydroxybenzoate transporter PcaK [Candidatus Celerinatantimonas neptuna]|nr:MAG: 4-hydroxybenzoate transporter PcaK [Candidatus Celerinatantimonas neptuna]
MDNKKSFIDPRESIKNLSMTSSQVIIISICILLNSIDGFDVLAISFASPGISTEWQISQAELGVVLAMELIGMAIGSIIIGGMADIYGRRPTILGCMILMIIGMLMCGIVTSVNQLLVFRFITGLGVGGMLASINALTAEFSNLKYRNLCVVLMAAGYPLGAVIGGSICSMLLRFFSWHAVFFFGSSLTTLLIVIVWFKLPESIDFIIHNKSATSLQKINGVLSKINHQSVDALPPISHENKKSTYIYKELFSKSYRLLTILLITAYFFDIFTFYYIVKWIPKLSTNIGLSDSHAGLILVWANIGGMIGALIFGLFSSYINLKRILLITLICTFVMLCIFGNGFMMLGSYSSNYSISFYLSILAMITGFFSNSGVVGMYALMAQSFPARIRSTGTGIVIGIGRGGAALSPIIAGVLFQYGFNVFITSSVMGMGALLAGLSIFILQRKKISNTLQTI